LTRRDVGFLLIGIGVGLILTCIAVIDISRWMHHMFIMEIHWEAYVWIALPWLFLIAGSVILYRQRRHI
jgi:hypothetical protein